MGIETTKKCIVFGLQFSTGNSMHACSESLQSQMSNLLDKGAVLGLIKAR
jgi:hypothetical protein